jgi:hypothetical protein
VGFASSADFADFESVIAWSTSRTQVRSLRSHDRPIHNSRVFKTYFLCSTPIVAIQFHHLAPGGRKLTDERLQRVAARIDFREGSELKL